MAEDNQNVMVIKMNIHRKETWRYPGRILSRGPHNLLLEAYFNKKSIEFHGFTLKENDRFLELYFEDRWYNIFEIHDWENDLLKGWYCNVTTPAEFSPGQIAYVDLALDVLVYPDWRWLVLDQDEFEELHLEPELQNRALEALSELVELTKNQKLANLIQKGQVTR